MDIFEKLEAVLPNDAYLVTEVDADIDIAGPKYWTVEAPVDKDLEIIFSGHFLTAALLEVYSAPTVDTPGTELTPTPLNRRSSVTATATFRKDDTTSDDGDLVLTDKAQALTPFDLPKLVLERGGVYILKATSIADNNNSAVAFLCREVA